VTAASVLAESKPAIGRIIQVDKISGRCGSTEKTASVRHPAGLLYEGDTVQTVPTST